MKHPELVLILTVVSLTMGCGSRQPQSPVLGEAYAGPSHLELRKEILPASPTVATVKHGERLEIVQVRRRFYRVRTPAGMEGWTHERSLLSREEVEALTKLREAGARQPSQGTALLSQETNVHSEPVRLSPSFTQAQADERVSVLAHRVTPRDTEVARKTLLPPKPAPVRKKKAAQKEKKHVDRKGNPLPPFPKGPAVPGDWLELSRERTAVEEAPAAAEQPVKAPAPKPQPMDEWTLVRRSNGDAGWVLRSRLMFDLPENILQYAEGKRITSYFVLGEIAAEGGSKPVYLWTTVSSRYAEYDFDLMRLFFWNTRRKRYETGYIERNLRGFLPIVREQVDPPRGMAAGAKVNGLSFVAEKADGARVRRSYAFLGDRLRFSGEAQVK